MPKQPIEVFGYPITDQSTKAKSARKKYFCPFTNVKCKKQSRLIKYPMGVCSVLYNNKGIVALCPSRFLENRKVFEDIADEYFGSRNNLMVFSEVGLKSIGNFDYVMVKHRPLSSEIEDFVVIEFQTGQTSGTGKLVQGLDEFMKGTDIKDKSYSFGLNVYDIWKREFTQILNKGIVMEAWKRKIFWVVQEQIFKDLVDRYHLDLRYDKSDSTIFSLYDLQAVKEEITLVHTGFKSSTIDSLFNAIRHNPEIPERQEFEKVLTAKARAKIGFEIV